MPRREKPSNERKWWVVLPTYGNKLVGPPTTCSTLQAAQDAIEESRDTDEFGVYADYGIRQMTASELAYELSV
jgi:hypothetical protein